MSLPRYGATPKQSYIILYLFQASKGRYSDLEAWIQAQ